MPHHSYEGIVVLGAPRSGTTLVRRLLNAHPDIVCPPETNLLSASSRFLHEEQSAEGLRIGVLSGLAFAGFPEDDVIDRLRQLVLGFYREIVKASGKRIWAEKTAFDIFHLDGVERLMGPSCRFLCVCRHGLDVACSMKELSDSMDRYLPELHYYVQRYSSPLEAMAHAWVDANARLAQFIKAHPSQSLLMRYEDLLSDPSRELHKVFDFLETPTDVDALVKRAFSGGADAGLGDWKSYETSGLHQRSVGRSQTLARDVIARLADIINPTLASLGYDAVPVERALTPEQARQRFRAMKMVRQMQAARDSTPQ